MATSIKIDDDLRDRIQHLAEAKERFKAEALASWSSYKETGMHLTGEEVQDWLSTWGTDREARVRLHK